MSRLDIINVVYGETFTNFFVEVSLPSQLSPGNIPALREAAHSAYNIYTTKADAPVIRAARSFQALERLMPVNLVELSMEEIRDPAYRERMGMTVWSILSMIHKQAIQQARHDTLVFLAPDWVIADGSFAAIEARIDQGYEAVVISGPRIDWDRAESTFRGWVRDGEHLAVPG
ncbi:MAG: hypothetical protein RLZZ501_1190, partial [Pseudomonadota bacterium]